MKKIRADELLIRQELVENSAEAKRYILAGLVRTHADHVVRATTEKYPQDTILSLNLPSPYVSRGAYKLKDALDKYWPATQGLVGLDIGASTGGFTDLMLQKGVAQVYAVDSGHSQLHYKLRNDERVLCLEKTNARHLTSDIVPCKVDLVTADVSFISITAILPAITPLMKKGALAFILIKPQFEVPREHVGDGIIRDLGLRQMAIDKVVNFCEGEEFWSLLEVKPSPIKGPKGNQEYMAVFRR